MSGLDTIAALSSAKGDSSIAIIRLSGPEAGKIASSVIREPLEVPRRGFMAANARLSLGDAGELGCRVYFFVSPFSYTTEDIVEFHVPCSELVSRELLVRLTGAGARMAQPGEFTKRAYLGGRLDLAQAEAVGAVIQSRSRGELEAAGRVLAGEFSDRLEKLSEVLKDLLALIEVSLDFSDQDVESVPPDEIYGRIDEALDILNGCVASGKSAVGDAAKVLICGLPNVGKSSLFNRLLDNDRAIVADIPGTTRDLVGARTEFGGAAAILLDSAGKKAPDGDIEKSAMSHLEAVLEEAALAIFVTEAHKPPSAEEMEFFSNIRKNKILVANKSDLGASSELPECEVVSCVSGEGLDSLRDAVERMLVTNVEHHPDSLMLNLRQRNAAGRAVSALRRAKELSEHELVAEEVREALQAVRELRGEDVPADILDRIFDRFCIGK